jgi:CelD/BcsL family acetyltransferase involved in cellulose biosynthesis
LRVGHPPKIIGDMRRTDVGGVFSSDAFLGALGDAWFDGDARPGHVAVGEHVVRTLIADGRPVLDVTFLDFFEPVDADPEVRGRYAPRVATVTHSAADVRPLDPLVAEHAPFVDWTRFSSWDEVQSLWKQREKGIVRESRRRAGRLERELGPLRYTFDDGRREVFDTCLAWKSAQFRDSGLPDPLEDPRERELLLKLWASGAAVLNSLDAGGRTVAAHLGLVWGDTTHWWLPGYDRDVSWASPGRLLLEWVMQQSYERGDTRFDFLRGGSTYKWNYATDYRVVVEAGRPPLLRRARLARARAARRYPRLAAAARTARDNGARLRRPAESPSTVGAG